MKSDAKLAAEVRRQMQCISAGAKDFIGADDLRARLAAALQAGRPLRVKLGLDPSAPDLHLGHSITLHKLKVFQQLGHTPIFLVGDFTARIGDPTGRNKTRPALAPEQIQQNAETYVAQARLVLDCDAAEIRYNGEWMEQMAPDDFVRLCARYTVARMLERDDFTQRYQNGAPIMLHEFLYPLVQAYDSVALKADVELGGADQLFNLLVGREIQKDYGQPPQAVMTHPLLVGLEGREKMSKSLGNCIGFTDAPDEMYGRTMRVSDELMAQWIATLSFGEWEDLPAQKNPLARKQELARRITARFHGAAAAEEAAEKFRRTVQRREPPKKIPQVKLKIPQTEKTFPLPDALQQIFNLPSKNEARRLLAGGAVQLDGEKISDPARRLAAGEYLIRAGKRRFARVLLR